MLNRSASLAMSTNVLEALPGKPDIKRHSRSILYIHTMFLSFSNPSQKKSPSDICAVLVKIQLSRQANIAFLLVSMFVPGHTPKNPFSGLIP